MEQTFKTVITSEHKLFDLHLRETFGYRDRIFLFVKRDFSTLYKQTILGPLWAIIQPLFTTVVFTIIFGSLAGLTTADTVGDFVLPGFTTVRNSVLIVSNHGLRKIFQKSNMKLSALMIAQQMEA